MLERTVAHALVSAAVSAGVYIRKCHWEGRVGAPDYLLMYRGRVYFVETKAPGEVPRASQQSEFAKIRAHGVPVWVVDSAASALSVIQAITGDRA